MRNKILKLLIVAFGLCLSVNAVAVEYEFQKINSFGREKRKVLVPQQTSEFSFLSEQQSGAVSDKSLLNLRKSSASQMVSGGDVMMPAFSSRSVSPLYEGFDVPVASMTSAMSLNNLNGPMKEPPMKPDPWTPVGEGLVSLLLMAGLYIVSKYRK